MIGSELYDFNFLRELSENKILIKLRLLNDWLVEIIIISWGAIKVQLWRKIVIINDWMY